MSNKNLLVFPDARQAIEAVATAFLEKLTASRIAGERFTVALSGGSTPEKFNHFLSAYQQKKTLDWHHVDFFWGDERMVPPDDEQSNYRMAKLSLLDNLPLTENQIHRIHGEAEIEPEIRRLSEDLRSTLDLANDVPVFDWIFLGMGDDGHTASLFPGAEEQLASTELWVPATHPQSGQKRISLTLPVINAARQITFLVFGENKAEMLKKVLSGGQDAAHLPAAMVNPVNGRLDWYVDEPAAAKQL